MLLFFSLTGLPLVFQVPVLITNVNSDVSPTKLVRLRLGNNTHPVRGTVSVIYHS